MSTCNGIHTLMRAVVRIAALALPAFFAWPAGAVPADPKPREVVQADGSRIVTRLRGDEYFSWRETIDGYPIIRDPSDGTWRYAVPTSGKAELQAMPGGVVGKADPVKLGLKKHGLPAAKLLRSRVEARRAALNPAPAEPAPSAGRASYSAAPGSTPPMVPVVGVKTVRNVVILACFSNHWDDAGATVLPAYGTPDVSAFSNLFNQVGYTTDGATGSVRDYYNEVSYGKLLLKSTVTVWVRLPREGAYYHDNQSTLAADAIAAADAAGVDFSQFDSDGDGWVDALDIIHSGYGEEATANPDDVWSVKGALHGVTTKDGVKMYAYHTEPALRGDSGSGITRIGVICHETGHFFGLPDLYDYSSLTDGLGNWCIMAGGSWNGSSGSSPAHFSAWCKCFLGFARTTPVHSRIGRSLPAVEQHPVVGMLRDGLSDDEYFLIENREKIGFDDSEQIHPGCLVFHVYRPSENNDIGTWEHPAVKVEEADGNDSLGLTRSGAEETDVWTDANGLSGGWSDVTGSDETSAMRYQDGAYYSRTNDPASYSYNALFHFSAPGTNMTLDARTLKTDVTSGFALPADYSVAWAPAADASCYEVQEGFRTVSTNFVDGAEDEGALHDNWYVAGKTARIATNASFSGMACYALLRSDSAIQSITLRKPFAITTGTRISYRVMSHIATSNGYLACELSVDGGASWKRLSSHDGYIDPWLGQTNDYARLNALGIAAGATGELRFVMNSEYGSGWSGFPNRGFALDEIRIEDIEMADQGNWTTLSTNVTGTSLAIAARTNGTYCYRVQAFAHGEWQGFGSVGETIVSTNNHAPSFLSDTVTGQLARVGSFYAATLADSATDDDINDALTFSKSGGPAWLTLSTNGVLSGTPMPNDLGFNTITTRVTDLSGAYAEALFTVFVAPPQSALADGLVAYLPFDRDFLDYSGRANNPTALFDNSTTGGCIGAGAYVLDYSGYLSFGDAEELHFPNTQAGNSASFTVSFWGRTPAGATINEPVYIGNKDWAGDTNTGWTLAAGPGTSTSGFFQMNFKESNANSRDYDSTSASLTNGWHHYVAVFQREAPRTVWVYADGALVYSNALYSAGGGLDSAGLSLNIGDDGTGANTRGYWSRAGMDDFAFWRRALTAGEVAAIYTAGTNGYGAGYAEAAPIITGISPDGRLASYGETATLSPSVICASVAHYQWRQAGVEIPGAIAPALIVTNLGIAGVRVYDVIVTNAYGSATSATVTVTLDAAPAPVITSPASGAQFLEGGSIPLAASVTSNGTSLGALGFYVGTNPLYTAAAPPYAFVWTNVAPGSYTFRAIIAYDGDSAATSMPVNVTVNYRPPVAVDDAASTTSGAPVSIAVLANDNDAYGPVFLQTVGQPSRGSAAIVDTNVVYTPKSFWFGRDSFSYVVTNLHGLAATATVAVTTHYADGNAYAGAVASNGAVAYWRLNELSGSSAVDSVGHFTATNVGGLALGVAGVRPPVFPAFGATNTAYRFSSNTVNGTSIAVPALNLNTNTVTLSAWLNRDGLQPTDAGIFMWRGSASAGLRVGTTNEIRFSWNGYIYTSPFVLPDNQWAFVALAITPTNQVVYMSTNGNLRIWTNTTANVAAAFDSVSSIGWDSYGSTRRFNGAIDEVAIFGQALTAAQIGNLLLAAQTASPTISLTAPTNGASFAAGADIPLAAAVTTNGYHTIEKIQFLADASNVLSEVSSGPTTSVWHSASAGAHTIQARLFFDGDATLDSSAVIVTNVGAATYTLRIVSDRGSASPAAGLYTNAAGSTLTNAVIDPAASGGTQFVCVGWTLTGLEPAGGTGATVAITLTNDAVLTWMWATNYWLEATAGAHGGVDFTAGWLRAGTSTQLLATAAPYYRFDAWSGGVSSTDNPLTVGLTGPLAVTAGFVERTAAAGTPEWWLASYGWTNAFDAAETNDIDGDGMKTWQEYVANTVPTDSTSRLEFRAVQSPASGGGFVLEWSSASNRLYGVSCWTNLDEVATTVISNLTATPPMNTYTDAVHGASPRVFYRIDVRR